MKYHRKDACHCSEVENHLEESREENSLTDYVDFDDAMMSIGWVVKSGTLKLL